MPVGSGIQKMHLQNRVTPFGEIAHLPAGLVHRQSWHHLRSGDKDLANQTVGDKDVAGV